MSDASVESTQYPGRRAIVLSNETIRAVIEDLGGMVPEFSIQREKGSVNAHWIPPFRMNLDTSWSSNLHSAYWKGRLLSIIAGDFTCAPNFGPDCAVDGASLPAHGYTAQGRWSVDESAVNDRANLAWARSSLYSPDTRMPLDFRKLDLVRGGQSAYYSAVTVSNRGSLPVAINIARHNTLGSPFLETGCRISMSATHFATPPRGTEFDNTGRLAVDTEFGDLIRAPCRDGGVADLSVVPGMIGATDFITGPVPLDADLGWICVVNPAQKLAYLSFFPGPRGVSEDEIGLGFNDLWMQYGGRHFTPWALYEGGRDRTFCLGTENARAAFANGLAYSRAHPDLMGSPTLASIPAHSARTLFYGTALIELDDALAVEGIDRVEADDGAIVLKGKRASQRLALDGSFSAFRALMRDTRDTRETLETRAGG